MKLSILALVLVTGIAHGQTVGVKGPPHADEKELKHVAHVGETVRLVCPVSGYPQPMMEWSKNGEKIDFMWIRHKTSKRALKIKDVNVDDTGIFMCKGVNGFGSAQVRIELIVVDPRSLPKSFQDPSDIAPPVFTHDTQQVPLHHVRAVGETFRVSCEALGSPQPEIFWFKDGQHIDESVHYTRGRSMVEFKVLGTADSGMYTCRARNMAGERMMNFTLEVKQPVGTTHAIVIESGPPNTTVVEGKSASLSCRVKALSPPHIKWLKRLQPSEPQSENELTVGDERYRILSTNREEEVGNDEYLSKLILHQVKESDTGMYICFVTNSGFGALTYNSMNLQVARESIVKKDSGPTRVPETFTTLIIVVCVALLIFFLLMAMAIYCIRNKTKSPPSFVAPDTPDVQRPFMAKNNNQKFLHPLAVPTQPSTISGQWPNTRYSVYPEYQQQKIMSGNTDSGFDASMCLESNKELDSTLNQYEVPYSHLLPHHHHQPVPQPYTFRPDLVTSDGSSTRQYPKVYQFRNVCRPVPPKVHHKQYFSDYESQ